MNSNQAPTTETSREIKNISSQEEKKALIVAQILENSLQNSPNYVHGWKVLGGGE